MVATAGFSESFVFDNETSYPNNDQKSKIAVQWASSAKEVDEGNKALMYGYKLNPSTFQIITKQGKVTLNIPEEAQYFRVLAWSNNDENPDLITNWVDVEPNKTYTLTTDHLVPTVLMSGTGC
ncbi:MAG: hypothetical protein JSS09_07005 [Verrucomicrobia bacterium]|nr:hypothetical protein [Verrucomicrobiota bacterium]